MATDLASLRWRFSERFTLVVVNVFVVVLVVVVVVVLITLLLLLVLFDVAAHSLVVVLVSQQVGVAKNLVCCIECAITDSRKLPVELLVRRKLEPSTSDRARFQLISTVVSNQGIPNMLLV